MAKKATKVVDELQQRDGGALLTVKELKTMLDDGLLDLRMRAMSTVPVKAIAQISQATHIDLSTNLLQILPNDFATALVRITKLDLSRNAIVHLPDNFGELKNLISLDLYKNQIEDLPLSFCKLNQLKWLDLKDNPLNPELANAAGDCLDEKQCKKAALQVVRYVSKLEQDHERIRQQQLQQREAQRRANEESEMGSKEGKECDKEE